MTIQLYNDSFATYQNSTFSWFNQKLIFRCLDCFFFWKCANWIKINNFLTLEVNMLNQHARSSPPWELELRPLGVATGNALSVTRVWRYICKNTTCWPATAHDVTTGVPQYKCRREDTSSAFSSSLTGLFEACNLVRVQFSLSNGEH